VSGELAATETLLEQREAWERRPLLRELYTEWYRWMADELSAAEGPTVELGAGIGTFKEFLPQVVGTDVLETPWADEVVDAQKLPYSDASIANVVMFDVLHHLPAPLRCMSEVERVLLPGGRVVMVEPFCSPVSRLLYRVFHHEPVELGVDPFSEETHSSADPWDANTALPTLIFWRGLERFRQRHPDLHVIRRERFAWLLYPLSGGFSGRRLVPYRMGGVVRRLEATLPLSALAGLRCLVVLEKR
jgi:SAM-dependent methyltransferase